MNNGINSLSSQLPVIKRARDFHLYDFSGRRYLDLCLDGGRAVLGHKAGRIVGEMKNGLEKGLAAGYPSVYSQRLLKQIQRLYPVISSLSVVFSGGGLEVPVVRPFSREELPSGVFELILPMAGSGLVRVLCASGEGAELPLSNAVPGYLLSGLCRAAAELACFDKSSGKKAWAAFESPLWRRDGPWLYAAVPEERYPSLFNVLLAGGVIISPDYLTPSCAPCFFTEGEIAPIKEIEGDFL